MNPLMRRRFLVTIYGIALAASCAAAALAYSVDDKLKLEQAFSQRVTHVLENVVGKGKVLVFVDVLLETTQIQKQKEVFNAADGMRTAGGKWAWDETQAGRKNILPGFPVKNTAGNAPAMEMPGKYERITEQQYDVPQTMIKQITVAVTLDTGVKADYAKSIPGMVAGILNMNKERGDRITLRRIPFPPQPGFIDQFKKPEIVVDVTKFTVVSVIALFFLLLFFSLLRNFMRDFSKMAQSFKPRSIEIGIRHGEPALEGRKGGMALEGGEEQARLPAGEPETEVQPPSGAHFGFVTDENIGRLLFLLEKEDPQRIAITLSFLKAGHRAQVLAALEPAKRVEVTHQLARIFETPPGEVLAWETEVKEKINYVLGGSDLLTEMIDLSDSGTREQILADIAARSPDLAAELREGVFLFGNIGSLDDKDLKVLASKVANETLALALQGTNTDLVDRIIAQKPAGAQKLLRETIDLMGRQPPKQIDEARLAIVRAARQLIKEGYITPRKVRRVEAFVVDTDQ